MLINQENIQQRFNENLEWATEIDLATAWTTNHAGLRALRDRTPSLEVRAVVGLWGNTTEPKALEMLADMGKLRTPAASRRFHPKVYVFRGAGRSVAWIGSANFTSGGFGMNVEVLFETSNTEVVESWFDRLWEQCDPLDECAIHDYANLWGRNRPQPSWRPPVTINSTPMRLLEEVDDWRSYVAALEQCDRWWWWWSKRRGKHQWSVLGETDSWRKTIQDLHDVAKRKDWRELSDDDRSCLLGLRKDCWALLGRMRPPAKQTVFDDHRGTIQKTVLQVVAANDAVFPDVAIKAYEDLVGLDGVGPGIATRLLALARPDRFVSLNTKSSAGLADFFGLAQTTLEKPHKYGRLLEAIYDRPWFREPAPKDERERTICWMRAALLDCFVYDD